MRLTRRPDPAGGGNERGSAMAVVLIALTLGLFLAVTLVAATTFAAKTTSASRAGVQSQAAAEAGIDVGYAALTAGAACTTPVTGTSPQFVLSISYRTSTTGPWIDQCPTDPAAVQVRLRSTGTADAKGIANTSGDTQTVEAVYGWTPRAAGGSTSGSALYVYSGSKFNAFTVTTASGETNGDIVIRTGNFACSSNTVVNGSVTVATGAVDISNTCTIKGSLRATGDIAVSAQVRVEGDVISSGGSVSLSNNTISVGGSVHSAGDLTTHAQIAGSVTARGNASIVGGSTIGGSLAVGGSAENFQGSVTGPVSIRGNASLTGSAVTLGGGLTVGGTLASMENAKITGNVTAAGTGTTTFFPGTRVTGDLRVGGVLDSWGHGGATPAQGIKQSGWVTGAVVERASGLPVPGVPSSRPAPTAPDWVDVGYQLSDWTSAGYSQVVWPSNVSCQIGSWNATSGDTGAFWTGLQNRGTPTVVDARSCDNVTLQDQNVAFKANIAFVGRSFTLGNTVVRSGAAKATSFSMVVPDANPNLAGPQCSSGDISTWGANRIQEPMAGILYTPCNVSLNNQTNVRGQIYSGTLSVSANDGLVYVPVGIPGVKLGGTTGTTSGGSSSGSLGAMVQYSDVAG